MMPVFLHIFKIYEKSQIFWFILLTTTTNHICSKHNEKWEFSHLACFISPVVLNFQLALWTDQCFSYWDSGRGSEVQIKGSFISNLWISDMATLPPPPHAHGKLKEDLKCPLPSRVYSVCWGWRDPLSIIKGSKNESLPSLQPEEGGRSFSHCQGR